MVDRTSLGFTSFSPAPEGAGAKSWFRPRAVGPGTETSSKEIIKQKLELNLIEFSNNSNKYLIIWNTRENISFYKERYLLNIQRDMIKLTDFNTSVLIGVMLSDGHMEIRKGWNPRIRFEYSIKSLKYVFYLYSQLGILINNYPVMLKRKLRGRFFYCLTIRTRQLACLNSIYTLFYNVESGKRQLNLDIYDNFNYIVLAHWIMGDGSNIRGGMILCTDSYSFEEVIFLMNILKIKYNIDSTITYHTAYSPLDLLKSNKKIYPRIYINKINFDKVRTFIEPYFVESFLYKIKIK